MDNVSRREVLKLAGAAAAVGATALGTSVLFAGEEKAEAKDKAAPEHPNTGKEVESKAQTDSFGPKEVWAVVGPDGKLCRGQYVRSTKNLGTGQYEVIFMRDVRKGVYLATVGLCGASGASAPGQITVVGRVSDVNGVFIETADSTGKLTDLGFHLLVVNPEGFA